MLVGHAQRDTRILPAPSPPPEQQRWRKHGASAWSADPHTEGDHTVTGTALLSPSATPGLPPKHLTHRRKTLVISVHKVQAGRSRSAEEAGETLEPAQLVGGPGKARRRRDKTLTECTPRLQVFQLPTWREEATT